MYDMICTVLGRFLPYAFIIVPTFAICRTICFLRMKRANQKTTVLHEVGNLIFVIYLFDLCLRSQAPSILLEETLGVKVNLIPINKIADMFFHAQDMKTFTYAMENVSARMLLFLPIGILIPVLWQLKTELYTLLYGFLCSFFLQVIQYILIRQANVDDIILNTLGTLLGYMIYLAIKSVLKSPFSWFRITKEDTKPEELQRRVTF